MILMILHFIKKTQNNPNIQPQNKQTNKNPTKTGPHKTKNQTTPKKPPKTPNSYLYNKGNNPQKV